MSIHCRNGSMGILAGDCLHPGVTCDVCGMYPIEGNRFTRVDEDYDLCAACYAGDQHTQPFMRIASHGAPPEPWQFGQIILQTCPICLDDHCSNDLRALRCGHLFHENCIGEWLFHEGAAGRVAACPCCRFVVQEPALDSSDDDDSDDSNDSDDSDRPRSPPCAPVRTRPHAQPIAW